MDVAGGPELRGDDLADDDGYGCGDRRSGNDDLERTHVGGSLGEGGGARKENVCVRIRRR